MEILLIRHGESEADLLHVHEGRANFELTALGRQQVQAMAQQVKAKFPPDFIWASTLKRASETASILADAVGCPVQFEDDLMEYNNGILAGLSYEKAAHILKPSELHIPIEGGESTIEFRMRIEMIFSRIVTEGCPADFSSDDGSGRCNRIAIVAHGGVINNILRAFFKLPINREFHFKNGDTALHLIEITATERTVHFLNDTSHLNQKGGE